MASSTTGKETCAPCGVVVETVPANFVGKHARNNPQPGRFLLAKGNFTSGVTRYEKKAIFVRMGQQKIKRIADFLEKLAVAGIALGIFQEKYSGMVLAVMFFIVSLALTEEP